MDVTNMKIKILLGNKLYKEKEKVIQNTKNTEKI